MSSTDKTIDPVLEQMLSKREELAKSLEEAQARLDTMDRAIADWAKANQLDLPKRVPQLTAFAPVGKDFIGLALPAATRRALELVSDRQPKTASQIFDILDRHNAGPTSAGPVKSVQIALNRRHASDGDVIHVGAGNWGLTDWYSQKEIDEFSQANEGARIVDKEMHSQNMKIGIARIKAKGAHYGAAPKITPQQWDRALELVRSGVTKMSEIHREIVKLTPRGQKPMVAMTVSRQKDKLLNLEPYPATWKAHFDAHPPNEPASDQDAGIRLVK